MDDPASAGFAKLVEQIDHSAQSFDKKRTQFRRRDQNLFLVQASLILLTTIFAGLKIAGADDELRNAAVATSALASFLTMVLGRFAYRDRWIAYTDAWTHFIAMGSRLEIVAALASAGQRPWPTAHEIMTLDQEMQSIHDRVDARWRETVTATSEAKVAPR
jgi:hypothetical protein